MEKNDLDRIIMLFSYKDAKTGRKGYDIVVEKNDGFIITDGQDLADHVCAFGKALVALKGYTTYFALDFRYCTRDDISNIIAEMQTSIRVNANVCNIYDGFYSSVDLSSLSSSNM